MHGTSHRLRLGVNIDHVATLRNARGGAHPDPLRAAQLALAAGADGVTAHLREDRRHINDRDLAELIGANIPVNLEMAATDEMLKIALAARPAWCCLVPEHREERTTEGGLNVAGNANWLKTVIASLKRGRISVSLFIEPDLQQIEAARDLGAEAVELHTGAYSNAVEAGNRDESDRLLTALQNAAGKAAGAGVEVHAGHGLSFANVRPVAAIPEVIELQIGHFLIGEAVFIGLEHAIRRMRQLMDDAR
jgi:pyridoxine 5-phosphate synthase